MFKTYLPKQINNSIDDINFSQLFNTFNTIIFDFDNTLMPWGSDYISDRVKRLFKELQNIGFNIIIATNGKGERYKKINELLPSGIDLIFNVKKPDSKNIEKYINRKQYDYNKIVLIGDNLITDIYSGNKLGIYTIKVKPIAFREYWATKLYRIIEFIIFLLNYKYFRQLKLNG